LNSDLKVLALRPYPLDHIPTLEAAERFELSSSEVEARRIRPFMLCRLFLPWCGMQESNLLRLA
jgi:hypothetical protein